jgi:alkaline phosphatase
MKLSRRRFAASTGLFTLSGLTGAPAVHAADAGLRSDGTPGRIIHLVSDGMSAGTFGCADQFSWLVRKRPLAWTTLYERADAVAALVDMRSLNSLVTDSAAAASSWGSGSRVRNGSVNVLPDGRELKPLYDLFGDKDWARGLVTTTEITHATPAGFAANALDRGSAELIATQYLDRGIEVLLGGGEQFFDPASRADKRDLKADYRAKGYRVMSSRSELESAPASGRWLGTFTRSHLPYSIDHAADEGLRRAVPTLAEMTRAALRRLGGERHFILQVEGGRVDHAAHASDAAALMWDQLAFDDALAACLEFQRQAPDTLVVVTTDHGNSNPGLNGMGSGYASSVPLFASIKQVKKSLTLLQKDFSRAADSPGLTPQVVKSLVLEGTGCELTASQAEGFARFLEGQQPPLYGMMNAWSAQMGQLLANHLGIGWSGTAHTSDYVPLVAVGRGAERFRGFLQNTDLFHHYLALVRVDYRNPELPLMAESGPSAAEAEGWLIRSENRVA